MHIKWVHMKQKYLLNIIITQKKLKSHHSRNQSLFTAVIRIEGSYWPIRLLASVGVSSNLVILIKILLPDQLGSARIFSSSLNSVFHVFISVSV